MFSYNAISDLIVLKAKSAGVRKYRADLNRNKLKTLVPTVLKRKDDTAWQTIAADLSKYSTTLAKLVNGGKLESKDDLDELDTVPSVYSQVEDAGGPSAARIKAIRRWSNAAFSKPGKAANAGQIVKAAVINLSLAKKTAADEIDCGA